MTRINELPLKLCRIHQRTSDPKKLIHAIASAINRSLASPQACAIYSRAWPGDKTSIYCMYGQGDLLTYIRDNGLKVSAARRNHKTWQQTINKRTYSAAIIPLIASNIWYGALFIISSDLSDTTLNILESITPTVISALERDRFSSGVFKAHLLQRWATLKNRILSDLSHELRTPLASIKGYSTALLRDDVKWSSDMEQEFLQTIEEEANNLERLIAELLDTSMVEAGMFRVFPEPVLLPKLVSKTISELEWQSQNHTLVVEIDPGFPVINADPARLSQVLRNLLDNAIKYSPEGGLIVISARGREKDVLITIADQGLGISPEHLNRLFERYFRIEDGSAPMKGTGLGLPISREIIEAHGGTIWVESELRQGTTIYFTLPQNTEVSHEQ